MYIQEKNGDKLNDHVSNERLQQAVDVVCLNSY